MSPARDFVFPALKAFLSPRDGTVGFLSGDARFSERARARQRQSLLRRRPGDESATERPGVRADDADG